MISHKLMIRCGLIKQLSSGIYCWLPLGVIVIRKIEEIIRYELNKIIALETILPSLQPSKIWKQSGRESEKNETGKEMFNIRDSRNKEFTLPPSGEEAMTLLIKNNTQEEINTILYQITWKFRNEIRPRHGVMRSKEFLMQDAYSFNSSKEKAIKNYETMFKCYLNIFKKLEIDVIPVLAHNGDMGGNYSHEFHLLTNSGDSEIFYDKKICSYLYSIKNNIHKFKLQEYEKYYAREAKKHKKNKQVEGKNSIEIAHMFYLGNKYSSIFDLYFCKEKKKKYIEMGCYGIGVSRLLAAIIECKHDDKGIVWPRRIRPFEFGIINRDPENDSCNNIAEEINSLLNNNVLYDDSKKPINMKYNNMETIGIPKYIIIGKNHGTNGIIEIKERNSLKIKKIKYEEFIYNINKERRIFTT